MRRFPILLLLILALAACRTADEGPRTLTVITHDSFDASEEVIAEFERANGTEVRFVAIGDAGSLVNQAVLSKNNPLGDLLFGVDNTFLSRALDGEIFEPYASPALATVPDAFEIDPEHRVTPIDYGDVCLNYDTAYFAEAGLAPPADLDALTDEAYRGLLVVENPATSSPGLAFLLATVARYGEEGWQGYWEALRANDVHISPSWEDAYYGQFSGGAGEGERPIVVSYASSPPAEIIFAEEPPAEPPTASVTSPGSCFRQIEFAGILANAKEPELARAFIDFMLSPPFQEDIPLKMFVFPVVEGVELPEAFQSYAELASEPATMAPDEIGANRERLVEAWTAIMLR